MPAILAPVTRNTRALHMPYAPPPSARAQEYIDQHSLQKVVEDVLNGCVKTKPDEPLTFMVRDASDFGSDLTADCWLGRSSSISVSVCTRQCAGGTAAASTPCGPQQRPPQGGSSPAAAKPQQAAG